MSTSQGLGQAVRGILRGKDAADAALRRSAGYFQDAFGRLPETIELLERWVRERLR